MTERSKGLLAINVAAIIFDSAALYGKLNVSPVWIVALRGIFAAIALLIVGIMRKEIQVPSAPSRPHLAITGALLCLHWLTFFYSVQFSGVAVATLTFAVFPLFTLILEAFTQKKRLKPLGVVAGSMIVVAVALLVKVDNTRPLLALGAVLGLASAVLFAFFGTMSKALTGGLSTISVSFYQNVAVFVVLLPFMPFTSPRPNDAMEWVYLLMLGIITTALMHQLYLFALKRLTAGICSGFVALEPVYAILFASLLFSEPVSLVVAVSGMLILIASFLILIL